MSKYTEAFDSLRSDEKTKQERIGRILSSEKGSEGCETVRSGSASVAKVRKNIFSGRRGVALITAIVVFFVAVAVAVPVGIRSFDGGGVFDVISKLKNTYVDMEGIAAFGVWNAPDNAAGSSAYISDVSYVKTSSAEGESETDGSEDSDGDDIITGDWSDEDRYEWESDYDWDPSKANVLISIGDDGKVSEVVYERTNGRGEVRQDVLGNAAMVYVSDSFTYVMYVSDKEWEFWQDAKFAQEMIMPNGFACHHESAQTVVIHNATGKVFALNDIFPQVSELSGETNHTLQADPFKRDLLCIRPMYGNLIPQWYNVIYDEKLGKIRYELALPTDCEALQSYSLGYNVRAVHRDIYGQQYLLEGCGYEGIDYESPRVTAGIVELPSYKRYGNSVTFSVRNGMMFGTDHRMYVFDEGKLKVFGEDFRLYPVEAGTEVAFEGVADEFDGRLTRVKDSVCYKLENGYLYSMFGEVWKVNEDGTLHSLGTLEGSFPRYADDGYLIGGELIAFVDTELTDDGRASINGRMVRIRFDSSSGVPKAEMTHIIDASEISMHNNRMVVQQNENPHTHYRGETKYFLITVAHGKPVAEYFAYGYDGGATGLTKPITEPLILS